MPNASAARSASGSAPMRSTPTWKATDSLTEDNTLCIGCRRCSAFCPTGAITIKSNEENFKRNESWSGAHIRNLYAQADTGGILLAAMGNPAKYPIYWDHMLLDASQVTNPSIDPLREPMELAHLSGQKAALH